jgi:hypothetical protein
VKWGKIAKMIHVEGCSQCVEVGESNHKKRNSKWLSATDKESESLFYEGESEEHLRKEE